MVSTIEPLCVDPVEKLHPATQAGVRRFDEKMVVVAHQAVRMTDPAVPLDNVTDDLQEAGPIAVAEGDPVPRIATTGDVIERTFVAQPQRSRHGVPSVSRRIRKMKV